jgi:hypothetical protein
VEDQVELAPIGLLHVMTYHLEARVLQEMDDVALAAREIVVEADKVVAALQ